MIEPAALLIFMTATFVLLITPGPAVLFIIARSLEQGRWAGSVRGWLAGNRRWAEFQRKFAGTIYIGLGITTALTGRKS